MYLHLKICYSTSFQTWGCGKNKKRIKEDEEHLLFKNLPTLDENDDEIFIQKVIICIAYLLGRRGRTEISLLKRIDIKFDRYPRDHPLGGLLRVSMADHVTDKRTQATFQNPYGHGGPDQLKRIKVPIFDISDPGDPAATIWRSTKAPIHLPCGSSTIPPL